VYQDKIYVIGGTHFYPGFGCPPQDVLNLVEEYTPEDWQLSVSPSGKLPTKWGMMKQNK
jgi:hypothetical protein